MNRGEHLCPCCQVSMGSLRGASLAALACERCGGLFIDNAGCWALLVGNVDDRTEERLREWTMTDRHQRVSPVERGAYRKAALKDDEPRRCPTCRRPLAGYDTNRERHGVVIHLDVCRDHGAWFDRGEAWAMLQGVQLTRMAASFAKEMDRRDREWSERGKQNDVLGAFLEAMFDL